MTFPVRAGGLLLALAADALLADPARGHPVAGFGQAAAALERRWYADDQRRGVAFVAVCAGVPIVGGLLAQRRLRGHDAAATVAFAAATWAAIGATSLRREGARMAALLADDDLDGARARLSYLCARDATGLDGGELTRATVESLAENSSDALVAPLFWALVAGLPGVLGYRAINTLDAMVGYRSPRYQNFGWAAARLDDLANLIPARLTAALVALVSPLVGGSRRAAWSTWRRDGSHHPSPNAGQCEAAFAGALGVTLGGRNTYGAAVEDRARLGDGPTPQVADITRAARLVGALGWATAFITALVAAFIPVGVACTRAVARAAR